MYVLPPGRRSVLAASRTTRYSLLIVVFGVSGPVFPGVHHGFSKWTHKPLYDVGQRGSLPIYTGSGLDFGYGGGKSGITQRGRGDVPSHAAPGKAE